MNSALKGKTELSMKEAWFVHRPWIDRPNADIEGYCSAHREPLFNLKQKLEEWFKAGVIIFENAVDLTALEQFEHDLKWVLQNPQALPISVDVAGTLRQIDEFTASELAAMSRLKLHGLHAYSAAGRTLCLTPTVATFLRHIFNDQPAAMSTLTFIRGSQQMAHADFPFVFHQTCLPYLAASWIPLEDVHPDSGPLAYYPGSHRVDNFGFYDFGSGQIILQNGNTVDVVEFGKWLYQRVKEEAIPQKIFLPKRGDVLLWHAALVHEGLPIRNMELTRKSLVTHYTTVQHLPQNLIKRHKNAKPVILKEDVGVVFAYPWTTSNQRLPQQRLSWAKRFWMWRH
jgi:ectoine hydroxylase-related dioxygenase (phytanoyl-CoA dioxygenase family)